MYSKRMLRDLQDLVYQKKELGRTTQEAVEQMMPSVKLLRRAYQGFTGLGGGAAGSGIGFLTRARFEEKFKDEKEKTNLDSAIEHAPLLGAVVGAALGSALAGRKVKGLYKGIDEQLEPFLKGFQKQAALKKDVDLRPHQIRAIESLDKNDGSLLVAHATGSGKTLTGIAGFEHLKGTGKANRALVVVPASLRENFVENLKRFSTSSHAVYGPKGESHTKDIGEPSKADYNIVSYDLFREHGDKLLEDTGADTLIMDEIHRVRGTEGVTYNKLRDLRPKFKNAITLTGSVVNNEPNEVVPLMDITYTPSGHKLVSKKFFDSAFVKKDAKTRGILNPKVYIEKSLKNKPQLAKYLHNKLDYVSHEELVKDMPRREVSTVTVPMTKEQQKIYDFTLSSVDPITRWKIRNNIPVGQKEAQDAFAKLMQARQVSTDPAILDKRLEDKNPEEYSPKIKAVVEDLAAHLGESLSNKSVIYGNLLTGQLNGVEKALKARGIPYSKFTGLGNEGMTAKKRPKEIQDFQSNKTRALLISGAGAEGLDLKNTTMMQMLEGHYNPERIQQAEARVRRLGSLADKKPEDRKIIIKRYVAQPQRGALGKALGLIGLGGDKGVDSWIYSIAERKDKLNSEFRETMAKTANLELSDLLRGENRTDPGALYAEQAGEMLGAIPGSIASGVIAKRRDKKIEALLKQRLLDKGYEDLTAKRHYDKVMAESKLDERKLDAQFGVGMIASSIPLLWHGKKFSPIPQHKGVMAKKLEKIVDSVPLPKKLENVRPFLLPLVSGMALGASSKPLQEAAKTFVTTHAIGNTKDLDIGIERYIKKLRAKIERKYKSSKGFVQEYDTKKELGIDQIGGI